MGKRVRLSSEGSALRLRLEPTYGRLTYGHRQMDRLTRRSAAPTAQPIRSDAIECDAKGSFVFFVPIEFCVALVRVIDSQPKSQSLDGRAFGPLRFGLAQANAQSPKLNQRTSEYY